MTPLVAGSHIIGDLTENREICIPACIQRLHWGGELSEFCKDV